MAICSPTRKVTAKPCANLRPPSWQPSSATRLQHTSKFSLQINVPNKRSEPMFNVPSAVLATVAVLVLVHALRMLILTEAEDVRFLLTFAFIPARYDVD